MNCGAWQVAEQKKIELLRHQILKIQSVSYIWNEICLSVCLNWEINRGGAIFLSQRPTGMAWLAPREQPFYLSQHTHGSSVQISHRAQSQGLTKEVSWHRQSSACELSSSAVHTTQAWSLWMPADGHGVSVYPSQSQREPKLRPSTVLGRLSIVVFQTLPGFNIQSCQASGMPTNTQKHYKIHL